MTGSDGRQPSQAAAHSYSLVASIVALFCAGTVAIGALALIGWITLALLGSSLSPPPFAQSSTRAAAGYGGYGRHYHFFASRPGPGTVACFAFRRRGGGGVFTSSCCDPPALLRLRFLSSASSRALCCVRAATNFLFLRRNSIFDSRLPSSSANLCRQELMRDVAGVRQWHRRRRDMGEVIEFKRRKLDEFIPEHGRPTINLAEPITAAKFPTWRQGNNTAPSEYCAPDSDGA